jgi:hypothetical protein
MGITPAKGLLFSPPHHVSLEVVAAAGTPLLGVNRGTVTLGRVMRVIR